jgi:hypothetical protein
MVCKSVCERDIERWRYMGSGNTIAEGQWIQDSGCYKIVDVRCAGKKVCVLVAPAMDVRASMARDVQCKHVSNLHVILHNRHQQLGSYRIMLSVGAEKAMQTILGHDAPCSPG